MAKSSVPRRVWSARRGLGRAAVASATSRLRPMDPAGAVILITGGSSGIGAATARRFVRDGATVVLVARDEQRLTEAGEALVAEFDAVDRVAWWAGDVTDEDRIREIVAAAAERYGRIDVLINNAGRSIRRGATYAVERTHDYRRTIEANYLGAVTCTLAVLPGMIERRHGRIVNVSSISTQMYSPRYSAYVASKAALDAFGEVLAGEVATRGITVTSVKVPLTKTPMIEPSRRVQPGPALTPAQAAKLVARAVRYGQPTVSTPAGRVGRYMTETFPRWSRFTRQVEYLAFPESAAAVPRTDRA
ncbi:MAG TPA: SDR family NAD(P)-dependent oxidoreductase [Gordonia sp. (in: high G+C Gram-positive bacteria)]|uniref:SDR family NAD(P)-dependent oxidoreductase n=1 Tax=unclassified Gordonia (in: high G+C Gram-positive bacteria) TaxID=2657482 RepID=UPI000FAAF27F|nr:MULTISPECIES: SDR family NAD(P)-dependent oxidoreductase [unclassified Gordonia (in: high G+C Gram-positive bacteria)]RUP41484.1 MAG: SDR family NAD(P)-dependent oxidoreductase [Gordonia sp. (in: high G+C Gram-positive bacteria)]HNP57139.1 SDR family NAD(P)-dependent oxidoreductase [Gordonia sp. (in: high G+C Gram-positive bacteria)]HRC50541.1 SDR family NAD(P)-dependent oxidoreductase [Gordonia sp. (in: high G+C Gram-positive bacteria)]